MCHFWLHLYTVPFCAFPNVQVKEDYPLSDAIFVAHAHDQDRGANADVSYGLDTASQLAVGHTFKIHRSSGEVCKVQVMSCLYSTRTITLTGIDPNRELNEHLEFRL